jgi:hypothetical protein
MSQPIPTAPPNPGQSLNLQVAKPKFEKSINAKIPVDKKENDEKAPQKIDPAADIMGIMASKLLRLQQFKPKAFDYRNIQLDSTIALYGKRRTGKTFMTKWLWYQDQIRTQIPVFWVISPTAKINKSWENIIPSEYIFENFDTYFLHRVLERQRLYQTNPVMAHRNPWVGIMLDDAVADNGVRYSDSLLRLFIAGRHYKIHLVVTTQYPTLITPKMRANLDYAFIFTQISRREREHIRDQYLGYLDPHYADAIIDYYTQDNHCLVIDLSKNSTDPEECVFFTKADEPPKPPAFTLGCKEYWDVSRLKREKELKVKKEIQSDRRLMHTMDRRAFTLLDGFEDHEEG